jgi:hypothetical protein
VSALFSQISVLVLVLLHTFHPACVSLLTALHTNTHARRAALTQAKQWLTRAVARGSQTAADRLKVRVE